MNIYEKLLLVQERLEPIKKSELNPYFKSKYADINTILSELKPILTGLKLVLLQPLSSNELGEPMIKTILIDVETGDKIEDKTPLIKNEDTQKYGGTITYFRRYAIVSFFSLESEDDDGNFSSGKVTESKYQAPVKTYQAPIQGSTQTATKIAAIPASNLAKPNLNPTSKPITFKPKE